MTKPCKTCGKIGIDKEELLKEMVTSTAHSYDDCMDIADLLSAKFSVPVVSEEVIGMVRLRPSTKELNPIIDKYVEEYGCDISSWSDGIQGLSRTIYDNLKTYPEGSSLPVVSEMDFESLRFLISKFAKPCKTYSKDGKPLGETPLIGVLDFTDLTKEIINHFTVGGKKGE